MHQDYSHRTLSQKLGLKKTLNPVILNAPQDYPIKIGTQNLTKDAGFIQYFTRSLADLTDQFPKLKDHLAKDGMLWICWPKKSSQINSDLDENKIRQIGLDNSLVD